MVASLVHQLFVLDNIEIDKDPGQKVKRFREDQQVLETIFLGKRREGLTQGVGVGAQGWKRRWKGEFIPWA